MHGDNMITYDIQNIIIGDQGVIKKVKDFSKSVVETTNYKDSNQQNMEKIKKDHFISKIGEEAVFNVFKKLGHVLHNISGTIGPDYNIYSGKKKTWDHDLYFGKIGIAVKTHALSSVISTNGIYSWTFQSISQGRKDPILDRKDDIVVFVTCDDFNSGRFYDCTVYPPYRIGELKFSEPYFEHVKGSKKVVLRSDLPCYKHLNTDKQIDIETAWGA